MHPRVTRRVGFLSVTLLFFAGVLYLTLNDQPALGSLLLIAAASLGYGMDREHSRRSG